MRQFYRRACLALARLLARQVDAVVVNSELYVEAFEEAMGLASYALHSGHLTRAFHAGKRVQDGAAKIGDCLAIAEAKPYIVDVPHA